ncbi:MAG: citrate lyase subunit beta / citryl-CoA lyase [Solirubrobacteraceae bacterium]
MDCDAQLLRSLLFVPASDERKLAKVEGFGSDAIVLDLEDAVADDRKVAARASARAALPRYGPGTAAVVRVNAITTGLFDADIAAVVTARLDAIMVPKVEDAEALTYADRQIATAERRAGVQVGTIALLAILETPLGIARCESILAGAPARTRTSVFGSADFATGLGVELTPDAEEILHARSRVVVATRAAGLAAPIDGAWLWLDDDAGLQRDTARSRQLGFQGRIALHPRQVASLQRAYSQLSDEELQRSQRTVEAFEAANRRGDAALRVDGRFVDYPIYRLARERLARYEAQMHP